MIDKQLGTLGSAGQQLHLSAQIGTGSLLSVLSTYFQSDQGTDIRSLKSKVPVDTRRDEAKRRNGAENSHSGKKQ